MGEMVSVSCPSCELYEQVHLGAGMSSSVTALGCRTCGNVQQVWKPHSWLDPEDLSTMPAEAAELACPECEGQDVYELTTNPEEEERFTSAEKGLAGTNAWRCPACGGILEVSASGLWD